MDSPFQDAFLYLFATLAISIALLKKPIKTSFNKEINTSNNFTIIYYGKKRGCFITSCALFLLICSSIGPYIAITKGDNSGLIFSIPLMIVSIIVLLPSKYYGKIRLPTPLLLKKLGVLFLTIGLFYWFTSEIVHALATHEILAIAKRSSLIVNINKYPFIFWYAYITYCGVLGYIIYYIRSHILSEYFPQKNIS